MLKQIEARLGKDGQIHLREPIRVSRPCRVLVTLVEDPAVPESALLSERALARDWARPEEDEAWAHLQ